MYYLLTSLLICCTVLSAAQKPNIVLILADDLGWTDLSTGQTNFGNGSTYHETPNIDRLAAEGLSFPRSYVQQNCQPTRAALLSGQFAPHPRNRVYNVRSLSRATSKTEGYPNLPIIPPAQNSQIDPAGTSLHEMLKNAGYHTSWFGKYHAIGDPAELPVNHGVDYNFATGKKIKATVGGKVVESQYLALKDDTEGWKLPIPELAPYAQPYDQAYLDNVLAPLTNGNNLSLLLGTPKHLTDATGDAVVDYIRSRVPASEPFFVYLPFHAVHTKVVSRPDLTDKYQRKVSTDPRHTNPIYAGFVELLDQNVGKVLRVLDDPNGDGNCNDSIATNTLVIFCSDNGGAGGQTDNSPLRGAKGMYYEGGIRVPLICRWPGVIAPNTVCTQTIHCVDIFPTLAEVAGSPLPDPEFQRLDGESFAPILRGEAVRLSRDSIYWHCPGYMDNRQRPNSVIQKRINGEYYKLYFYYEDGHYELYNLTQDLSEITNLLEGTPDETIMRLAREMNTDLRNWLVEADAATGQWAINGETVAWPPADMRSHRIPTGIVIRDTTQFRADPNQNPFYPGPGRKTVTLTCTNMYDSTSNHGIPEGSSVTVRFSLDITAGPNGTISQDDSQINKCIGVDDGTGDTEPLKVDADNGYGAPEWLKVENMSIDEIIIDDPSGTMPTGVTASVLRAANFMPSSGSSTDLIVMISSDADPTTVNDNDPPRSVADGTLTILKWGNEIDRTKEFYFIRTRGNLWLKGLEVECGITLDTGSLEESPPFAIYDWGFGKTKYITWGSDWNKHYALEISTNLAAGFFPLAGADNISAQTGYFTTILNPEIPASRQLFLRVMEMSDERQSLRECVEFPVIRN